VRTFGTWHRRPNLPPEQRYRLVSRCPTYHRAAGAAVHDYHRLSAWTRRTTGSRRGSGVDVDSVLFSGRQADQRQWPDVDAGRRGMLSTSDRLFDRRDGNRTVAHLRVTLLPNLPQGNDKVIPALARSIGSSRPAADRSA